APPRFLSQPKKYYKVYEGGKVKLRCAVTGANDPNHNRTLTAWKKDGVSPRNSIIRKSRIWKRFKVKNGKYLRIRNVKKEDTGTYWCIAKNQNGMIKADIHVQVIPVLLTNNTKSHYVTATIETQKPKPTDDDIDPPSHTPDNGKPVIQKQLLKNATIKAGE
ncbi:hypothetical protein QZH41_009133, partial [Actinostola sp. cb2023]